ncbi:MAG: 30S ribosomal protein S5 [Halobacteriovoraceae bacterium]|jgi:small subunit ribosomal protein S5|nr:30S ribosomal protein S5 [Halobacteriovoraceae bacterium]MBT5094695.1 30S ribosomal protein S5 [Halobacteriovoraceae bacterium]
MTEDKKTEETKAPKEAAAAGAEVKADAKEDKKGGRGKKQGARPPRKPAPVGEFEETVVAVNRVAKVVKGGRRFSFSALMIVGDRKGRVGYGLGKAKEVPEAIRKATQAAQKNMIKVPIEKGTIPHIITGKFDAGMIIFKPASDGTGVKAAGACRSILELAGVKNVLTKSVRGNNPHNIVKATFRALSQLRSVEQVAKARGKEAHGLRLK